MFTIGADGARLLAQTLKTNTSLEFLGLTFNDLGDEGASWIAEALAENRTLREVVLADNGITSVGAERLAQGIAENMSLELLGNRSKLTTNRDARSHNYLHNNVHKRYDYTDRHIVIS